MIKSIKITKLFGRFNYKLDFSENFQAFYNDGLYKHNWCFFKDKTRCLLNGGFYLQDIKLYQSANDDRAVKMILFLPFFSILLKG